MLVVIDALKPAMLERAVATGRAPALARIREEGVYVDDCVAAFPSVTPVCAATITTGVGPDEHLIPSMNWYHREEGRYVEYGSSFSASRQFGVLRSLTDTVYQMNAEHLSHDVETVFESLDDADVRTAGTTYLIYRGRHQHEVANETRAGPDRHLDPVPAHDRRPAGAVLRRPLRVAARPAAAASSACPGSATSTPAAWAPTWSSTTCSTSCCSRCPTTTPGRTATARTPR